jgi:hypothetical protein
VNDTTNTVGGQVGQVSPTLGGAVTQTGSSLTTIVNGLPVTTP